MRCRDRFPPQIEYPVESKADGDGQGSGEQHDAQGSPSAESHPIESLSTDPLHTSHHECAGKDPLNEPSPLSQTELDNMDSVMMVPFVPGKIVLLHPMEIDEAMRNKEQEAGSQVESSKPQKPGTDEQDSGEGDENAGQEKQSKAAEEAEGEAPPKGKGASLVACRLL
jgi:hypothetical protein